MAGGRLTGRYTFSVNTTRKLTQKKEWEDQGGRGVEEAGEAGCERKFEGICGFWDDWVWRGKLCESFYPSPWVAHREQNTRARAQGQCFVCGSQRVSNSKVVVVFRILFA